MEGVGGLRARLSEVRAATSQGAAFRKDEVLAGLFAKGNINWLGGTASRASMAAVLIAAWLAPNSTESAVANGDTRTITFSNSHTEESGSFTYMVNGVYDQATLDKLNWFLRDWRINEPTKMDPHLFDIIWEVYRESGSQQPIDVLSAYRSPQTNAMLRRRSRQVAEHSQHMEGRAVDAHFVDVGTGRIRDIAMRMQEGGVGFYPTGATPWVHIDSGSVRYWPRMSRDALARLFPDGKTVFIPSDGQPMPGYDQARAEIEQRGGEIQTAGGGGGLFAWLFGARGGGEDDAEEGGGQETMAGGRGGRNQGPTVQIADAGPEAVARAKRNLSTGPTYASAPAPAPAPAPAAAPAPQQEVAALEQPNVESDASPDASVKLRGPSAALYLAPLPPRRPIDLNQQVVALTNIPLPPVRPSDLVAASVQPSATPPVRPTDFMSSAPPETTASIAPLPPIRPASFIVGSTPDIGGAGAKILVETGEDDLVADVLKGRLPKVITRGVTAQPTSALALTEMPPGAADDNTLLARAAEMTAPLPPMPIPNVGAPSPIKSVTGLSAADVSLLFGAMPVDAFKTAPNASELRGAQQ
jgi:uncharacterized protein YcbK (DUF882 family)